MNATTETAGITLEMLEAGALCIGIVADDGYSWERIKAIARETYEAMERERLAGLVSDRAACDCWSPDR